jgi:tryptophan 2,3-dioxygenase
MTLTYHDYLEIEKLLEIQVPRSEPPEHDETLFIIIHQTYELWFKQFLHEMDRAEQCMIDGDLWVCVATLKRMRMVMKTLVQQVDILETMTPLSFVSFRDRLDTASGFQSVQFRILEFRLGHKRARMLDAIGEGVPLRAEVEAAFAAPTLQDRFHQFLVGIGCKIPQDVLERDVTEPIVPNESVQEELLRVYRECPDVTVMLEMLTDIDEGLQEWRYRHVKLAERTIGTKIGTGGSDGVEFLKKSLFRPMFPDLWAIRAKM